ncbi:unnamed protein product [Ectocarpus sp. CCAP 1310/34]|nr:unnamed protein product [Ectocarpus sp. CCAP 1310/34]
MADIGSDLVKLHDGRLGDVARGIGGTLVSPPLDVSDVKQYFGEEKGFPGIDDLLEIVGEGAPAPTLDSQKNLEKAYAMMSSDTGKKVRIMNDFSFTQALPRGQKVGSTKIPLCTEFHVACVAKPHQLEELASLRVRWPDKRILAATADVTSAFRNVRISPDHAHNFCYVIGDVLVADLRLTFGWAASPGLWGVLASAAEHSHRNTSLANARLLPEGIAMMSHVKIKPPWEKGTPTPIPSSAGVRPHRGGGPADDFLARVYVDDFLLTKVQHDPTDQSALIASALLASDHVRLFGKGELGKPPILSPKKSTDWDTVIEALGYIIDTHAGRIATTPERVSAIRNILETDWPHDRKKARVQQVLSIAGKLWNLTHVIRAGRYFVWQLLRLSGLHTQASRHTRSRRLVDLGREFHGDIAFWKWALNQPLALRGESLSASFLLHVKRAPSRLHLSDASFTAIGGYCPELKIFWRYTIDSSLSAELKPKAQEKETSDIDDQSVRTRRHVHDGVGSPNDLERLTCRRRAVGVDAWRQRVGRQLD